MAFALCSASGLVSLVFNVTYSWINVYDMKTKNIKNKGIIKSLESHPDAIISFFLFLWLRDTFIFI